jgi:hypothetical protein
MKNEHSNYKKMHLYNCPNYGSNLCSKCPSESFRLRSTKFSYHVGNKTVSKKRLGSDFEITYIGFYIKGNFYSLCNLNFLPCKVAIKVTFSSAQYYQKNIKKLAQNRNTY